MSLPTSPFLRRFVYRETATFTAARCRHLAPTRPQPVRAHFNRRATSKSLIRATAAPRSRNHRRRPSGGPRVRDYGRQSARDGKCIRPFAGRHQCCRQFSLPGQRTPAHSLVGCAGHRPFLRPLGIEIVFGREGRLGTRTIRITAIGEHQPTTSSAPSAVSATMEIGRVYTIPRPDWNRHFNRAAVVDGDDAKSPTTTQECAFRRPDGVWFRLTTLLGCQTRVARSHAATVDVRYCSRR